MTEVLALILGVGLAAAGGELFVRGAVGISHALRVPPGIIGATVVAFATSSPELSVSASAALAGAPQIGLGDALGSNVVNIALVLGITLAISGAGDARGSLRRDFPVALLVPVITALLLLDGVISRLDGLLMLGAFAAWLVSTVVEARRARSSAEQVLGLRRPWMAAAHAALGLGLLIAASQLIVYGAKAIALALGVDPYVIGATLVAVGTSAPELATALVARLRGHDELSLGTLLGSNIFNGLFIVAVAATIHPIEVRWTEVAATLGFGLAALAFAFPWRGWAGDRRRGVLLLVLYAAYAGVLFQMRPV
ncbi:MAG TPA: calcium/sodium antiporter [Burkholderiales bacterium]